MLVGGFSSLATGLYFQMTDQALKIFDPTLILFNFFIGFMFSALSQMGFFAYLIVNYMAKGMIRRKPIWTTLQWILIIVVFVDLIVLRVVFFDTNNQGVAAYSVLPIVLLIVSVLVSIWKSKLTNVSAFTPTLFFLYVVTSLELVPALRLNQFESTMIMVVPLFLCNTWQILKLHTLVKPDEEMSQV